MDDNAKISFDKKDYEIFLRIKVLFSKHEQELEEIHNILVRILRDHNQITEDLKKIIQKVHCGKSANLISDSEPGSKDPEPKIARSLVENEINEQPLAKEFDAKVDLKQSRKLKSSKSLVNISTISNDTMHFGRLDSMLKKVKDSDQLDSATIDKCINLLCENEKTTPQSKRDVVLPAVVKKNMKIKHETRVENKASINKCLFGKPYQLTENIGLVSNANRTARSEDGSIPDSVIDLDEQLGDKIVESLIEDNEDQHLLAPSKVIKAPEAFNQKFFPQDVRNKPLMSKEELAQIKAKKTMVKSKSIGWNMGSSGDNLLQVNQPRHSSLSPERSKEIDQLNAIGKFRNYKNFWENKSQEPLRPQKHGKIPIEETCVVAGPVETQPNQVGPANKNRISIGNASKIPLNREGITLSKNLNVRPVSKDKKEISNDKQGLATTGIAKNSEPVNKFDKFAMDQAYARQKMASMVLKKSREDEQGNKNGSDIGQSIRQKRFQKGQSKLAPTRSLDLQYLIKHRKEIAQQGVDISPQLVRDFSRAVLDEKSDDLKALPSPNTLLPGGDGKINQWRAVKHDEGKPALDLSPRSNLRSTDF